MTREYGREAAEERGRVFTCQRCGSVDEVVEVPVPFLPADAYVCDVCHGADEQLVFEVGRRAGPARRVTRRYDPKVAPIPFAGVDPRSDWLSREPVVDEED